MFNFQHTESLQDLAVLYCNSRSVLYTGAEPFSDLCTVQSLRFSVPWHTWSPCEIWGNDAMCSTSFVSVRILAATALWISGRSWISCSKVIELHYSSVQTWKKTWRLSFFCAECMEYGSVRTAAQILMMSQSAAWRCCRVGCHVCAKREPSPSRYSPHGQMHLMETPTHSPVPLPTWGRHLVAPGCNYSPTSRLPSPWPALLDTKSNLWCEAQAFSSGCMSIVGQYPG